MATAATRTVIRRVELALDWRAAPFTACPTPPPALLPSSAADGWPQLMLATTVVCCRAVMAGGIVVFSKAGAVLKAGGGAVKAGAGARLTPSVSGRFRMQPSSCLSSPLAADGSPVGICALRLHS